MFIEGLPLNIGFDPGFIGFLKSGHQGPITTYPDFYQTYTLFYEVGLSWEKWDNCHDAIKATNSDGLTPLQSVSNDDVKKIVGREAGAKKIIAMALRPKRCAGDYFDYHFVVAKGGGVIGEKMGTGGRAKKCKGVVSITAQDTGEQFKQKMKTALARRGYTEFCAMFEVTPEFVATASHYLENVPKW
jgi:hypothetical protein